LRWVVSATGTDIFRLADSGVASSSARPFTGFKNLPEVDLDDNSTALVSAGTIADATDVWSWNLETAVTYDNFLAQGGYYKFGADKRGTPTPTTQRGLGFDGWYAEGSWVLTGESRGWSTANAAFTNPKPRENFSLDGALELAGRYSVLDLNDNEGVIGSALPAGGIRGGDQRIVTVGLNWYPNPVLKFMLQVQNVQISHLNGAAAVGTIPANGSLGQNFDTVALRSQIAF
jgi:phosphate-selective porin OprO/OprP